MACVSSVSYSVLLNGQSHGFIKPERGIRRGDPLSPFFFILCAKALVNALIKSEEEERLNGIKLARNGPGVHHLLFADDILLMCRASEAERSELLRVLDLYDFVSGQRINYLKSSIILGARVQHHVKDQVKLILGIDTEGGEGKYLGLHECFSGSKRKHLTYIHENMQGRMNGRYAKSLSQGGKEIFLKLVALALPVYAMSCFQLSKDLCVKLMSAMLEFWWSSGGSRRKLPWVA